MEKDYLLSPGAASLDKLESVHVKTRTSSINALRVNDTLDRIHMKELNWELR